MSDLATKVIELIEEGKNVLGNQIENSKPDVILFLGITRAGKSTLINYINDIQLESFLENGSQSYKLKAKDATRELPGIRIGQSTWNSCTRHPGTHTPPNMPFTYVDMPGFGDTGPIEQDIANAYFRSAIIEKANKLKIVLVVNYSDLTTSPGNLPKTLKDLAYFIESIKSENNNTIEKIKRSISIVVTKIADKTTEKKDRVKKLERDITKSQKNLARAERENNVEDANEERECIRENNQEIAVLINQIENESPKQEVANHLREFIANSPSLNKITNMREILTHIVNQNQYAVFSTPTKICNKDPAEAAEIQDLIHNQTTFVSKKNANIAIRVSDQNAAEVINAVSGLSFMAKDLAKSIDKDIQEKLKKAFNKGKEPKLQIINLNGKADKNYTILCTLKNFFKDLHQVLNFSKETLNRCSEFNKLLTLLIGLLPERDRASYSDKKNWVKELELHTIFDPHIKRIKEILKIALVKNIDKDIIQKLKTGFSKNNEDEIKLIKSTCEKVKTYTSSRTLEVFVNDVNKTLMLSAQNLKEFRAFNKFLNFLVKVLPAIFHEQYLNKINWLEELKLDPILNKHIKNAEDILSAPRVNFAKGKLTIQGYYIKTSQVDVAIQKHTGIKEIEIRAFHTVTIDNDLDNHNSKCEGKLHGVNLTMITPNVAVSGNRTIDLSGKDEKVEAKAANGGNGGNGPKVGEATRGNSGTKGEDGVDGLPGKSGGSAGNLSIICTSFPDHERLSVNLKGGNGAKGQDGGNGGNGGNGSGVTWKEFSALRGAFKIITNDGWVEVGHDHHSPYYRFLKLEGGDGGKGGNGGQGGKGGDAGKKGQCTVLANNLLAIKNLSIKDGSSGTDGLIGEAGQGGAHGREAIGTWNRDKNGWSAALEKRPCYRERGNAVAGTKPTTFNQTGWLAANAIPQQNLALALLAYNVYLEQQAKKYPNIVANYLYKFEERCEHIKLVDLKTTTKHLLQEANALEKYSIKFGKTLDFAPFYYSLLARIKDFALNSARTPQEIKVLEYLYVATLGSIARLNAAADNLLVIDIHEYVKNLVDRDLATLKTIKADKLKHYYREQYQIGVESKIEEAHSFLKLLKEDIRSRQQDIEPLINELKQEINDQRDIQTADQHRKLEQKRKLKEALHKKAMLGVMNIAIQGVGMMFPPAGPIVAAVVNAGLNMAANPTIETAVEFASKAVDMKTKLGNLPNGENASKHEEDLFKKVQEMAKTISPLIKDAKDLLSQQHEGNAQLAQLDSQIAQIDAYIAQLNAFLATVPASLSNYLAGMVNQVQSFQEALNDKSLVALDFGKLELKRFFENMKRNIKTVVGNFKTDGFEELATKMQEAMDVSLTICSRVQEYRDHIAFANFIAHLQSVNVQNVVVGAEYQQAVNDLSFRLQKSIVQEAYHRAIAAAKQWAFPFTERFFSAINDLDTNDETVMAQNLTVLLRRLDDFKTCITDMDQAITLSPFTTVAPTIPFFTWSYELQPQKFEALLKGEKVILNADVARSQLDVVKFNQIGIKFECALSSKQHELETTLQNDYQVTLEHSGVSYYKFAGNTYQVVNDKPLEIRYTFGMKLDGITPMQTSSAWNKMKDGDILLSPFTSWVVKIEPAPPAAPTMSLFDKFNDVKQHLKIRLIGEGSYVDTSRVNSNLNVDKYHHKVNKEEPLAISRKLSCYGLFKPIKLNNNNQITPEESATNTPQQRL